MTTTQDLLRKALEALEAANAAIVDGICFHESTHRAGAIWTICDYCDAKWADDRGGLQKPTMPKAYGQALQAIESIRTALSSPADQPGCVRAAEAVLPSGPVYRHKDTEGIYTVLYGGLAKQGDGEWVSSIFYQQHGTDKVFARDAVAFSQNFELVAAAPLPLGDGADAKDAARYRCLRKGNDYEHDAPMALLYEKESDTGERPFWSLAGEALDDAVDAAMRASPDPGSESAKPAATAPSDEQILEIAHRTASTYKHRSDPDTHAYGFVKHTLLDFARKLLATSGVSSQISKTRILTALETPACATPPQQAEPSQDLKWCASCGEGVTTFCRGKSAECAMQLAKPGQPSAERALLIAVAKAAQACVSDPQLACYRGGALWLALEDAVQALKELK